MFDIIAVDFKKLFGVSLLTFFILYFFTTRRFFLLVFWKDLAYEKSQ